jgi:hypothetical protein
MKRSNYSRNNVNSYKLSLRAETVRVLTERELALVVAGDCVYGSGVTVTKDPGILSSLNGVQGGDYR